MNTEASTITHRQFKDSVYEQLARVGKAMAAPKRIELLDLLCQAPRTVETLAELSGISVANASQHLKVLREARLVTAEKQGLYVEYRVADAQVGLYFHALRTVAETRLVELERITRQHLERHGAPEPVCGEELLRRVRAREVTVLDVRPLEEYRAGHIPGAISVPLPELAKRLAKLPKNREIVAYCRGPYCIWAVEAVELLRKKGFRAQRMEFGVLDWRARGYRVETQKETQA
ncbi:metalloregulator ArsR/SmtB family transcription factor [Polyangium sp. 15x6]|uniref:ArsR/SmtB family transcription factor n=1 Tax=Polyangium sp. 15x6 TaxID=3042687 RepID=UPI00249CB6CB|nr:metalloregulator ArsR/SmtB family transcription factor [Polyangium sp. 15x6]MDI3286820.1 metalloregulator ArsR/SmtB family transcription factor [Polyangium sp. 15x6]